MVSYSFDPMKKYATSTVLILIVVDDGLLHVWWNRKRGIP